MDGRYVVYNMFVSVSDRLISKYNNIRGFLPLNGAKI